MLHEPGEIVEYDPATFVPKQTVKMPPPALKNPESIDASSGGQILFSPNPDRSGDAGLGKAGHRLWLWNGQAAVILDGGWTRTDSATGANR